MTDKLNVSDSSTRTLSGFNECVECFSLINRDIKWVSTNVTNVSDSSTETLSRYK